MNKKTPHILTRLSPSMSKEEMVQNLIAALKKSGFTVKPNKQNGEAVNDK